MTSLQWKYAAVGGVAAVLMGGVLIYGPSFVASSHTQGDTAVQAGPMSEAIAKVTVVELKRRVIEETLTVYGSTLPAPDESQTFSVPYECRVQRVLVTAGRVVELGTPLIEVEPSHETKLLLDGAREEQQTAKDQFTLM